MAVVPDVSIIVPIYNVEEYLDECLNSLASQTLDSCEIILVDDGSIDKSSAIASSFASSHSSAKYYRIENAGLGHARNYGAGLARGRYLTFPDADDVVPEYAYSDMVQLGDRSQADIVIGDVVRFNSKRVFSSGLHRKAFENMPEVTHISETTSLIYDTTAWNKLFRAEFYFQNKLFWPEGILYEDIPVTIPAHFKATRVAYLDKVVYKWRARDGVSKSITQDRTSERNFLDRMRVIDMLDAYYDANVSDQLLKTIKDYKILTVDLVLYIDCLASSSHDFQNMVMNRVAAYLPRVSRQAFDSLPVLLRAKYECIKEGNLAGLLEVLHYEKRGKKTLSVAKRGNKLIAKYPRFNNANIDSDVTRDILSAGPTVSISSVVFESEEVVVEGECYSRLLNSTKLKDVSVQATLVDRNGNECANLLASILPTTGACNKINVSRDFKKVKIRHQKYRRLEVRVPLRLFVDSFGSWKIKLVYTWKGLTFSDVFLKSPKKGGRPRPYAKRLGDKRVCISYGTDYALTISSEPIVNEVNSLEVRRGNQLGLVLAGGAVRDFDPSQLDTDADSLSEYNAFINGLVCVALNDAVVVGCSNRSAELSLRMMKACGVVSKYCCVGHVANFNGTIYRSNSRQLEDGKLLLVGSKYGVRVPIKLSIDASEYGITYPFSFSIDFDADYAQLLRDDSYRLMLSCDEGEYPVLFDSCLDVERFELSSGGYDYQFSCDVFGFYVRSRRIPKFYERTRIRKKVVEKIVYPIMRILPIKKNLVIFESFWAASVGCNPLAIYRYLESHEGKFECVWSLNDVRIPVPGKARRVKKGSLQYFYVLARAKYLVNNMNFIDAYEKRRGQIEIQTMHGTPLKTLGLDVADEFPDDETKKRFIRRCNRWDYLIVQSPEVERITKTCYLYKKQYLRTGYPRNDEMFVRNNPDEIAKIKEQLGISREKKFVLYAPTWRVRGNFDLRLDLNKLAEDLGDEYTFGLRIHYMAIKGFDVSSLDLKADILDVSRYDSIDDLLLISDVVITDYSSLMFDYALLDRPMIFYVYDLEDYRDNLRGFNIDLETEAPGPLYKTTAEVESALRNLDELKHEYAGAFQQFKDKFLTYEHGDACERVYNEVFRD